MMRDRSVFDEVAQSLFEITGPGISSRQRAVAEPVAFEHYVISDGNCAACGVEYPCQVLSDTREELGL